VISSRTPERKNTAVDLTTGPTRPACPDSDQAGVRQFLLQRDKVWYARLDIAQVDRIQLQGANGTSERAKFGSTLTERGIP
jgi:hypothetical protein